MSQKMKLSAVRHLDIGTVITDLDTAIVTAGIMTRKGKQWEQFIKVFDFWCVVNRKRYIPLQKRNQIIIKRARVEIVRNDKGLVVSKFEFPPGISEPPLYESMMFNINTNLKENEMPRVNDLKDSRFLTKDDAGSGVIGTIKSYELADVSMESEPRRDRYVLYFHELDKGLVLNVTNGRLIEAITGNDDFDAWIGKKIILYNEPTIMFAGKLTGGIRVRAYQGGAPNPEHVGDNPPPPTDDEIPY